MNLDELAAAAHDLDAAEGSDSATLRLDRDEDVSALFAYFGADRDRRAVRLVIRDVDVGYLERRDVLKLFAPRVLGWGDSDRSSLPGHLPPTAWRLQQVECPVADCPDSRLFVASYDESQPPHCRVHPDEELRLSE